MKSCLNCWRYRGLTIAGSIQIFKTLAISKVVYISTMKNPPRQFIKALSEVQEDFVWNKSRSKIKHSNLIGNYEGGCKERCGYFNKTYCSTDYLDKEAAGWQLPFMENYSRKVICFSRWLLLFSL